MNIPMSVTADSLHVRNAPGIESTSLGFLSFGQNVSITALGHNGTWGQLDFDGSVGWCSLKYLIPTGGVAAPWLPLACKEIGVKEIAGAASHPRIYEYMASVDNLQRLEDSSTSWCSCFVNWCVERIALRGTNSAAAQSWNNWRNGKPADSVRAGSPTAAMVGDIAVWERVAPGDWHGHVSIFIDYDPDADKLLVLGGNQANAVRYSWYPRNDSSPGNYYKLLTLRSA